MVVKVYDSTLDIPNIVLDDSYANYGYNFADEHLSNMFSMFAKQPLSMANNPVNEMDNRKDVSSIYSIVNSNRRDANVQRCGTCLNDQHCLDNVTHRNNVNNGKTLKVTWSDDQVLSKDENMINVTDTETQQLDESYLTQDDQTDSKTSCLDDDKIAWHRSKTTLVRNDRRDIQHECPASDQM